MAGLTHLLDTDMMVEILRGRSAAVRRHLNEHEGAVAVSAITVSELAYGTRRSSNPASDAAALDRVLEMLPVLPFDIPAANEAADVRAELAARGEPIGPYDLLIAGVARERGLVVASGNGREFRRVRGLRVENWRR